MAKNIVICADGTGNTAITGRGTNVFKLYEAVDLHEHETNPALTPQVAFYHDGVGTQRLRPIRILSGAFGWGLARNVRDLYLALIRVWEPGDQIFLFGFSRGAFTVRTLAGLVTTVGIVKAAGRSDDDLAAEVRRAYRVYRLRYRYEPEVARRKIAERAKRLHEAAGARPDRSPGGHVRIRFIGVWDTVDAVGLPDAFASGTLDRIFRFKFPDYKLSPHVDRACHALAIDDQRRAFRPLLWNETDETTDRIEQVWFAGVHSNVGGGYPKQGMSLVTLDWMMKHAEDAGLRFSPLDRDLYRERQNVDDQLYDSRAGLAFYYSYGPRDIVAMSGRCGIARPKIHVSALKRLASGTEGYAPGNIPGCAAVVRHGPGEDFTKLETVLRSTLGERCLLDRVGGLVAVRRWSHTVCFWASALFLIWTLAAMGRHDGWRRTAWTFLSVLGSGGGDFVAGALRAGVLRTLAPVIVLAVLGYVVGFVTERRMRSVFSASWRRWSKELRDAVTPLPSRSRGEARVMTERRIR